MFIMFNNLYFSLMKVIKITIKHLVTLEDIDKSQCLAI